MSGPPLGSSPPVVAIADRVLLTPADVNGAPVEALPAEDLRPSRLFTPSHCRNVGYPSDAYRLGERAIGLDVDTVDGRSEWNGIVQYVAMYGDAGARDLMADLRRTLAEPVPQYCWTDLGDAGTGDESIMLKCESIAGYAADLLEVQFAAVIRVGRAIVTVARTVTARRPDTSSALTTVRTLAHTATDRVRAIA